MGNQELWRSSSPVGGGVVKLVVDTQIERGGRSYIYYAEPHPVAIDLDGDGVEEIVVVQNQVPGRMAVVYKGPAGYPIPVRELRLRGHDHGPRAPSRAIRCPRWSWPSRASTDC